MTKDIIQDFKSNFWMEYGIPERCDEGCPGIVASGSAVAFYFEPTDDSVSFIVFDSQKQVMSKHVHSFISPLMIAGWIDEIEQFLDCRFKGVPYPKQVNYQSPTRGYFFDDYMSIPTYHELSVYRQDRFIKLFREAYGRRSTVKQPEGNLKNGLLSLTAEDKEKIRAFNANVSQSTVVPPVSVVEKIKATDTDDSIIPPHSIIPNVVFRR